MSVQTSTKRTPSPKERFHRLREQWKKDSYYLSSVTAMAMLPSYQAIIGMGKEALPFILEDLREGPDHWFWALEAITQANPVQPEDQGDLDRMTKTWLEWAEQTGLTE